MIRKLLEALQYLKDLKITHEDLKPKNILILQDNSLKIIDFGVSLIRSSNLNTSTSCGTELYMSYEKYSEHWLVTKLCLRPDLTTPYAKPYLWTPIPYARMFFQNSFVNFLTFPLSGLFFVAHIYIILYIYMYIVLNQSI